VFLRTYYIAGHLKQPRGPRVGQPWIKTWLRSHRCARGMQIRTASQKSTVKQEANVEVLGGKCLLYSNYLV